ncbi:MAG: hypothetical protein MUD08_19345, partial [Cytophagales bacterium]|nr:hypothetical protein [Cytophagales bacterium]
MLELLQGRDGLFAGVLEQAQLPRFVGEHEDTFLIEVDRSLRSLDRNLRENLGWILDRLLGCRDH